MIGGLGYLGWAFRPLSASGEEIPPPKAHGLLVEARPDGALVVSAQGRLESWAVDGRRRWSTAQGVDSGMHTCTAGCAAVIASASLESLGRPEIADPAPVFMDGTGARKWPAATPRQRVLWAADQRTYVVAAADRLGAPLTVTAVSPAGRRVLGTDTFGHSTLLSSGTVGVLLARDEQLGPVARPLVDDGKGWRPRGAAVRVPDFSNGCFGVVGGKPVTVVFGNGAATLISGGRVRSLPATTEAAACAVSATGPVVGLSTDTGSMVVTQFDLDAAVRWQRTLPGFADLSADGGSDRVALTQAGKATAVVVGGDGADLRTLTAVGARVLGRTVVVLPPSGAPVWQPLP